MFHFHFAPRFAFQKKKLLSLKTVPALALPLPLEAALQGIHLASPRSHRATNLKLWRICLSATKPLLWRSMAISMVASLFAAGSTLVAMQIMKGASTLSSLYFFSFLYFLLNALSQFGNFFTNRLRAWVSLTAETVLVAQISQKLIQLSAEAAARQSSGNLKVLITSDVKNVSEFLNQIVRNLIPSVAALAVMAPLLIHFSGKAGVAGLVMLVMILPLTLGLNRLSIYFQSRFQKRMDELATLIGEWVKNIRLVRFLSWEDAIQNRLIQLLRRFMKMAVVQHFLACLIFGLSTSWWMISAASVLLFARYFHYPLQLTGFFGTLWLLSFISGYFTHLPNTIRYYGQAVPSIKRLANLLNETEQSEYFKLDEGSLGGAKPLRFIFERVSFQFPDAENFALQDLSLTFNLHEKLAILGEVGSGKSTFLKLLVGEIPPTSGTIFIELSNGVRRSLWEKNTYTQVRENLAFVPQLPYVSSDRLSLNISLGHHGDEAEIILAAHLAELEADLAYFDEGVHQSIGESGVNLSGGQKQRVNLARAFYSKRPLMILDDPFSAVDFTTEARLMKKLIEQKKGFILVTHRLSEIMRVEKVLVFKDGKIVEQGVPQVLASDPHSAFTRALEAYD